MIKPKFIAGLNAEEGVNYKPSIPFIDTFKLRGEWLMGGGWANQAEFDAYLATIPKQHDWLVNLPSGKSVAIELRNNRYSYEVVQPFVLSDPAMPLFATGTWIVEWDDPDFNVTIPLVTFGSSVATISSTRKEITLNSPETFFFIAIQQNTGSQKTLNALRVFHSSHETLLDAGEVFTPEYVATHKGSLIDRPLDWNRCYFWGAWKPNASPLTALSDTNQVNVADLPTEAGSSYFFAPASIIGKLSNKLYQANPLGGRYLHLPMPVRFTKSAMSAYATQLHAVLDPNIIVFLEMGNEIWGDQAPFKAQKRYLNNTYFPGLDVDGGNTFRAGVISRTTGLLHPTPYTYSSTNGAGEKFYQDANNVVMDFYDVSYAMMAAIAEELYEAFEAVFPPSRIVRVAGIQTRPDGSNIQKAMFERVSNKLGGGMFVNKNILVTTGRYYELTDPAYTPTEVNNINYRFIDNAMADKDYLGGAAYISTVIDKWTTDFLIPSYNSIMSYLNGLGYNKKLHFYEGGLHFATTGKNALLRKVSQFTSTSGNSALTYVQDTLNQYYSNRTLAAMFETGDVFEFENANMPFARTQFYGASGDARDTYEFTQFTGVTPALTLTLSTAAAGVGITATASGAIFSANDVGKFLYAATGLARITAFTSTTVVTVATQQAFSGTSLGSGTWSVDNRFFASKQVFVRVVNATTITLHKSAADATNNVNALTINATGNYFGWNITRLMALNNNISAWRNSELGRLQMIKQYNTIDTVYFQSGCHFLSAGNTEQAGLHFGLVDSEFSGENLTSTQYRKFNYIGRSAADMLS